MRILITGGNGFIGRHLVPLMHQHQLLLISKQKVSFDQPNLQHLSADLANPERWGGEVSDFSPNACIHLAWSDLPDYSFFKCRENLDINLKLLDLLTTTKCKKIFIPGTCWEYGDLQGKVCENDFFAHQTINHQRPTFRLEYRSPKLSGLYIFGKLDFL